MKILIIIITKLDYPHKSILIIDYMIWGAEEDKFVLKEWLHNTNNKSRCCDLQVIAPLFRTVFAHKM